MNTDKTTGAQFILRTPHNYDRNKASDESGLACMDPSRTKQSFKEEVDINTIVKRFGIGQNVPVNVAVPMEVDFIEATNYHEAMNVLRQANEAFMEMPAAVRKRFDNDPAKFLAFTEDEKNLEEARKLGVARPAPKVEEPQPIAVRVVDQKPAETPAK